MQLLPIFAKNAKINNNRLNIVNVMPSAKYASLEAKTIDTIVAFISEAPVIDNAAAKAGLKVGHFVFSDYGIDYYTLGIIASDDMIARRPDVVRRFVLATMKGDAWAIKNPQKAADDFVKNFPENIRAVMLQQWDAALPFILTDRARKNGLGSIESKKMADKIELILRLQKADSALTPKDIFTEQFLPDVKVN